MRITASLTALALLFTLAACQKVNLRGPAPVVGQTLVSSVETKTEPGNLAMNFPGQAIEGTMQTEATNVIEQTILEVQDGQPIKVQMKFLVAKTLSKSTINGQTNEEEDTGMQGAVMTQTKTADGWETDIQGTDIPQEAKQMVKKAGYVDQRLVFPDKPVGIGHTWVIEDELMQSFMGQSGIPGATFAGDMTFKLVDLKEEEDGQQIAVLDFKMDGTVTMQMSTDSTTTVNIAIKMKGDGVIYRNLTHYTTAQDFEGDMNMNMNVTAGGEQAMTMNASMPMTVKQTQERK